MVFCHFETSNFYLKYQTLNCLFVCRFHVDVRFRIYDELYIK
nr:MAG TPA: hypothetical protein [Caudoviricetes sp.]